MPLDLSAQTVLLLVAVVIAFTIASVGGRLVSTAWTRGRVRRRMPAQPEEPRPPVQGIDEAEPSPVGGTVASNVAIPRSATARRRVAWATPRVSDLIPAPGSTRLPRSAAGDPHPRRHGPSIGAPWTRIRRQPHSEVEDGD
jgi:hypothetical protein